MSIVFLVELNMEGVGTIESRDKGEDVCIGQFYSLGHKLNNWLYIGGGDEITMRHTKKEAEEVLIKAIDERIKNLQLSKERLTNND